MDEFRRPTQLLRTTTLEIGKLNDHHLSLGISSDASRIVAHLDPWRLEEYRHLGLFPEMRGIFLPRLLNFRLLQRRFELSFDLLERAVQLAPLPEIKRVQFRIRGISDFGVHFLIKEFFRR